MISALRQHQTISRLALLAAVVLCSWQTLNALHIHADDQDTFCVVCVTSYHDDDIVLGGLPDSPTTPAVLSLLTDPSPLSDPASRYYRQAPRAPPAS